MTVDIKNIFASLPDALSDEVFETILKQEGVHIERIISFGSGTPPGDWYDQDWDEWVLLLAGSAGLLFEDEEYPRELKPGDYLFIPAGCRHRVEWTSQQEKTVWLAVHIGRHTSV